MGMHIMVYISANKKKVAIVGVGGAGCNAAFFPSVTPAFPPAAGPVPVPVR